MVSDRPRLAWALLITVLLTSGCGGGKARLAPVSRVDPASSEVPATHTVRKGETLYAIAWLYGLDYRLIAAWNTLSSPHLIYPGQSLTLAGPPLPQAQPSIGDDVPRQVSKTATDAGTVPVAPSTPEPTKPQSATATAKPESTVESASEAPPTPAAADAESPGEISIPENDELDLFDTARDIDVWVWPTSGKVIGRFEKSGRNGIDINGRRGQSVIAASDGRVVYSGGGLIGYGKLIILKHNKRFLSAYAHNAEILIKEGDIVKGGQSIARMGSAGSNQVKLHFEIRRDGKPVNPLRYLPK